MFQDAEIALICGSDIVAHREMCEVVDHIVALGRKPRLYYAEHLPMKNAVTAHNASQTALKDYVFAERLILQETIFPYLDQHAQKPAANDEAIYNPPFLTPKQICQRYGLPEPVAVADINAPEFIDHLANNPRLAGIISLRCTQMFKADICRAMKAEGRFILNLHSGVLPRWRGLYSTGRAMADAITNPRSERVFGATLHHVEPFKAVNGKKYVGIDTGNIVDFGTKQVNQLHTVYANNIILSALGAQAVIRTLDKLARCEDIGGYPQNNNRAGYHSIPNADEVGKWQRMGVILQQPSEVLSVLSTTFMRQADPRTEEFEKIIRNAVVARMELPPYVQDLRDIDMRYGADGSRQITVSPDITRGARNSFHSATGGIAVRKSSGRLASSRASNTSGLIPTPAVG